MKKERRGRPRTERARKFERLAYKLGVKLGTAYHYIAGTRPVAYSRSGYIIAELGGEVGIWCEHGYRVVKEALFAKATLD